MRVFTVYFLTSLPPVIMIGACNLPPSPSKQRTELPAPKETEHQSERSPEINDVDKTPHTGGVENNSAPLTPPCAYFGELPLAKLKSAPQITRIENGAVVLIIIDALNAKHLSTYGYHRQTSSHLDKLAKQGLLLSNYITNSSWTRPSFATIITGLTKSEHKVELSNRNLDLNIKTLAERFLKAGYRTAGFVGNPLVRKIWGFGQGFQVYKDTKSLNKAFPPDKLLVDKAIDWLGSIGEESFFLLVFLTAPHTPYRPPNKRFLAALPEGSTIQYPFREYKKPLLKTAHDRIVAAYDDEILYADRQVGRLISYLTQTKKMPRTSVLVTADHGEAFGDHNCYTHTYHMWESVLRVPFVLVSPVVGLHGVYDDRPFTHIDIAPTLLDLAGIEQGKDDLPGSSLIESLQEKSDDRQRIIFTQYDAHGIKRQAIRKGRWKLIHHHQVERAALRKLNSLERDIPHADPADLPSLALESERYELYDLVADPGELKDLFAHKKKTKEFGELIAALQPRIGEDEIPEELSPELTEALLNAGYLRRSEDEQSEAEPKKMDDGQT